MHVSLGDGVRRRRRVEVERNDALESLRIGNAAQRADADKLAINRLGSVPFLLDDVDGADRIGLESSAINRNAKRGMNGVSLRVFDPGIEALGGFGQDSKSMLVR